MLFNLEAFVALHNTSHSCPPDSLMKHLFHMCSASATDNALLCDVLPAVYEGNAIRCKKKSSHSQQSALPSCNTGEMLHLFHRHWACQSCPRDFRVWAAVVYSSCHLFKLPGKWVCQRALQRHSASQDLLRPDTGLMNSSWHIAEGVFKRNGLWWKKYSDLLLT